MSTAVIVVNLARPQSRQHVFALTGRERCDAK
jgi:hypothetical protein